MQKLKVVVLLERMCELIYVQGTQQRWKRLYPERVRSTQLWWGHGSERLGGKSGKTWQVFLVQDARVLHRTEGYKKHTINKTSFLLKLFCEVLTIQLWDIEKCWGENLLFGHLSLHEAWHWLKPYIRASTWSGHMWKVAQHFGYSWLIDFCLLPFTLFSRLATEIPLWFFFGEGKWSASLHLSLDTAWMLCMLKKLILPNYARTCQNHHILSYTTLSLSLLTTL
jgi:hypothetical protein